MSIPFKRQTAKGFTLVELIVVLVVLALLAAIAIPTFAKVVERSQDRKTEFEMDSVQSNAYNIWFASHQEATPLTMAAALVIAAGETPIAATGEGSFAADATTFTAVEGRRASQRYGDIVYTSVETTDSDLIQKTGVIVGDITFSMQSPTGHFCWAAIGPVTDIAPLCGPGVSASPHIAPNENGPGTGGGDEEEETSSIAKISGLVATPGNGSATLTWTPLGSGDITGYLVYLFDEQSPHGTPIAGDATLSTAIVENLVNGQPYVIRIRAVNGSVLGPLSDPVVVTPLTGPSQVQNVTVKAGVETLYVTWADNNYTGAPVSYWEVFVDGVSAGPSAKGQAWKLLTDLNGGQEYTITVVAQGTATAPPSQPVTATPYAAGDPAASPNPLVFYPPVAPTRLAAVGGNAKVTLAWPPSAVSTSNPNPVSSYTVFANHPTTGEATAVSPSKVTVSDNGWRVEVTNTPFGQLQNGTSYTFFVVAAGPGGTSDPSASATATPTAQTTVPTPGSTFLPPQGSISLSGVGGDRSARLVWTGVLPTSNAPVSGYQIYQDGEMVASVDAEKRNTVIDGLENDATYLFQVAAAGPGGRGELSEPVAITPSYEISLRYQSAAMIQRPATVSGVAATSGNTLLHLSWNRSPSTMNSPITGYRVYVDGSPAPALIVPQPSDPEETRVEIDLTGLTNGQSYSIQVTAYNMLQSPMSAAVSATPYGLPAQPVNVTANSPASATVVVSWDDIAATTAVPITGYRVHVNGSPAPVAAVTAGVTTATISGLVNGSTYSFQVVAFNVSGVGPMSQAATATPSNPPQPVGVITATGAHQRIIVSWQQVHSTPTTPVLGYDLYMDGVFHSRWAQNVETNGVESNTQSQIVSGLVNGAVHSFQLVAYNNTAASAMSAAASAVATPAPGAVTATLTEQTNTQATIGWTTPEGAGPFTGFRIYLNGSVYATAGAAARTATVDLNVGANQIQVLPFSTLDNGPTSSAVTAARYGAPNPITSLEFNPAPSAGSTTVTLTWVAPATGTYQPRDSYQLMVNGAASGAPLAAGATTATISGLSYGTPYTFSVNAVGAGGTTGGTTVSHTAYALPGQPDGLAISDESDGKLTLTWNRVTGTAQAPVTGYHIYKNAVLHGLVLNAGCGIDTCSTLIDGLTNGNTYGFNIYAYGPGGTGPASATAYGVPLAPLVISTQAVTIPFADSFNTTGPLSSSWATAGTVAASGGNAVVLGSASILAGTTPNGDMRLGTEVVSASTFNVIFRAQDENNFWSLRRYNINGLSSPCQIQLTITVDGVRTVVQNWPQPGGGCATQPLSGTVTVASALDGTLSVSLPGISHTITDSRHASARGIALQAGTFNAINVTATPGAPGNLTAVATSGSTAELNWTAGDGAVSYTATAVDQVTGVTTGSCTTTALTCTISTLRRAHTYNVSLTAQRDGLLSPAVATTVTMPSEFTFSGAGDTNGLIYYFGTQGDVSPFSDPAVASVGQANQVTVAASTGGTPAITDRVLTNVFSPANTANPWIQIGLPTNRSVTMKTITFRGDANQSINAYGSNNGTSWTLLGTASGNGSGGSAPTSWFVIPTSSNTIPYSKIRVQFSTTTSSNWFFRAHEMEVYGTLHDFVLAPPTVQAAGHMYKNVLTWSGGSASEWVVKRGGSVIATLPASTLTWEDTQAPLDVFSSYTITPKAADGTLGETSATVTAEARNPRPPTSPTNVGVTRGTTTLNVGFTAGVSSVSAQTFAASCTSIAGTFTGSGTSPISVSVPDTTTNGLTYSCTVTATNSDGSTNSSPVSYTIAAFAQYLSSLSPTYWWTNTQNSGTTTVASSGSVSNNLTATAVTFGATAAVVGRTTAAFNGSSSKLTAASSTGFSTFSVAGVVCTDGSSANQAIYTQRPSGTPSSYAGQMQLILTAGNKPSFGVYNGSAWVTASTTTALNTGQCYVIVGTRSSDNLLRLYVNGSLVATSGAVSSDVLANPIGVGYDRRDTAAFFNGRIGDVAVWNTALTAGQVASLFSNSGL